MLIVITGDHPRHYYFVNKLLDIFKIDIWIIEKRENFIPAVDKTLNSNLQKLQKIHFEKREQVEKSFFKIEKENFSAIRKQINIVKDDLENKKLLDFLNEENCINLITYGCHKINDEILSKFSMNKINLHGGLSPRYRGVITHFWPTYLLEPEYTGMTLHQLSNDIDGGDIILQNSVNLNEKDGIHENACRCAKNFFDDMHIKFQPNFLEKKINGVKQTSNGRIWTSQMWHPIHLELVYKVYEDRVNKFCIENKKIKKPNIISSL